MSQGQENESKQEETQNEFNKRKALFEIRLASWVGHVDKNENFVDSDIEFQWFQQYMALSACAQLFQEGNELHHYAINKFGEFGRDQWHKPIKKKLLVLAQVQISILGRCHGKFEDHKMHN